MTLTSDVMNDLLTVYLAGEASSDTRALVEAHAREDAAFGARLKAAGVFTFPDVPAGSTMRHELRTLTETRQYIRLRTIFCAGGILFSLMPLVFSFGDAGVEFLILGRHSGLVWAFWSLAAASWSAYAVMDRRIRQVGL